MPSRPLLLSLPTWTVMVLLPLNRRARSYRWTPHGHWCFTSPHSDRAYNRYLRSLINPDRRRPFFPSQHANIAAGQSRVTGVPNTQSDAQVGDGYDLLETSDGFLDSHAALMESDFDPNAVAHANLMIVNRSDSAPSNRTVLPQCEAESSAHRPYLRTTFQQQRGHREFAAGGIRCTQTARRFPAFPFLDLIQTRPELTSSTSLRYFKI